jgi:two-component system cell cycle sensor histidine kinase/response regulator CckA
LRNLVLNARDATPTGGRLTIATANVLEGTHQGDSNILTISNTWRGIYEETLSRLFDPFFTTKQEGKGTGLGLSTVYGFVKQSGGTISCDSRLGEGTTFRILLSRADAGEKTPVEAEPTKVEVHRNGTILIVEDEEVVRSFISRTLSMAE